MLILEFKYDSDKDIENFIYGTRAVNISSPTKLQQKYIDKNGTNYEVEQVRKFIKSHISETNLNIEKSVKIVEENWKKVEKEFIPRAEKLFGITYPSSTVCAYLTTNERCSYNIGKGFFFVNPLTGSNSTIMHELFHFYTWEAFHDDLIRTRIDKLRYNDIKESLTELLNIEFTDLMDDGYDHGYPQHSEMRQKIRKLWLETKDLRKVIFNII